MTGIGVLLGLIAGLGLLLVFARLPVMRRVSFADRIAPHLGGGVQSAADSAFLGSLAARLDRLIGGRAALTTRLAAGGNRLTVEQYRTSQVLWAVAGAAPGALLLAVGAAGTRPSLSLAGVALIIAGLAGGVAARDSALSSEIKARNATMLAELPAVADLLSLAVSAGESPLAALQRVGASGAGPLRHELRRVLAEVRSGASLVTALDAFGARTPVTALARFVDGLVVALERGTPLADLLRVQAADVREAAKRELMESGGRKEIAMMVPVVFLVLPTTVLFAAYPAFTSLTFVTP